MKKIIYKILSIFMLFQSTIIYPTTNLEGISAITADSINLNTDNNNNNNKIESIENAEKDFIEEILKTNLDPEITGVLQKFLNNQTLTKEELYTLIMIKKYYINNPWHDIGLECLDPKFYGLQTLELNQNKRTFLRQQERGMQKHIKYSETLATLSDIQNIPNLNINPLPPADITDSTWNSMEKLSAFRIHRYKLYRIAGESNTTNTTNTIDQDFDPRESFVLPLLSVHKKGTILFQEIVYPKINKDSLNQFTKLAADISFLFQKINLLESSIEHEKIPCQDFIKKESEWYEKQMSIEKSSRCNPEYEDLNRIGNNDGFPNITKRIIKSLRLGDATSINNLSLKSYISLKDVKEALNSDFSLTDKEKKNYCKHFFNIALSINKDNIQKYMNKYKRNPPPCYTNLNKRLKFIFNFSSNVSFLEKTKDNKQKNQYIFEINKETRSILNELLDLDTKQLNILKQIADLPMPFDKNFLWILSTADYLLQYAIPDIHSMREKLPLYSAFIYEIFLKKYALANLSLMHHLGKSIDISNQTDQIIYSNKRIASDGNPRDLEIDPEYEEAEFLGNSFNFFDGAGGSGKTSALETFIFEVMSASIIGKTAAAKMTIPKKMLENRIYFIQKNASVLHEPNGVMLSGSQSTLANMRDINRVCEEALSNNGYVFVMFDEAFSPVDGISVGNMISSHEAIKAAFDAGILFFQIIEHNPETAKKLSGKTVVKFPNKIESTQNKSNQINQFIVDEISLHTLEGDAYSQIEKVLSSSQYQSGVTIPIYVVINPEKSSIDLVSEKEYKEANRKNNTKYIPIQHTVKTSLNNLESESINVYIDSDAIYIKPLIGEIYFNNQYYIYIIPITIEQDGNAIKITQLKEKQSMLTPKSQTYIRRNVIQFFVKPPKVNRLPADCFATLKALIAAAIGNYRNTDLDKLNQEALTSEKPEQESIFKD